MPTPPAKRLRAGAAVPPAPTLVANHERCTMPRQPTDDGRTNGCWVPPVVALARFYAVVPPRAAVADAADAAAAADIADVAATASVVTVESVLAMRPGDDEEEVVEVLEQLCGVPINPSSWSDDASFFEGSVSARWLGPTSESDFGTRKVSAAWFADLRKVIDGGDAVLLLLERLEGGKDKGNTHFLLCLGYHEVGQRRGGAAYSLRVKDPMEGDALLTAQLWEEPAVELMTRQPSGQVLDRFMILESTHLHGVGALLPRHVAAPSGATGSEGAEARATGRPEEAELGGALDAEVVVERSELL